MATFILCVVVAFCVWLYFLPTVIAKKRETALSPGFFFLLNVLFGWTVLGWWVLLVMASTTSTAAQRLFYEKNA